MLAFVGTTGPLVPTVFVHHHRTLLRRKHLGEWPGPIVEEESNEVVGFHHGFWFHTVGQRKGIALSGGPW